MRAVRRFSLGINYGANSLSGAGLWLGYNFTPHLALDAGIGCGFNNDLYLRTSVQARANLFVTPWSPYFAAAVLYNWNDRSVTSGNNTLLIAPTVGLSLQARTGYSLLVGGGYGFALAGQDRRPRSAFAGPTQAPVLQVSSGYTF